MKTQEFTGKTTQDAIDKGLMELGVTIADVRVDVLQEGAKGLFGLFGSKPARVRLTVMEEENADEDFHIDWSLDGDSKKPAKAEKKPQPEKKPQQEKKPQAEKKPQPEKKQGGNKQPEAKSEPEKPRTEKAEKQPRSANAVDAEKPEKKAGEQKPEREKRPPREKKPAEAKAAEAKVTDDTAETETEKKPRERKPKQQKPQRQAPRAEQKREPMPPAQVFRPAEPPVLFDESTPAGIAQRFLMDVTEKMGVQVAVYVEESRDGALSLRLIGDTLGILIGRRGDTLDALQYLTSLRVNKGNEDYIRVTLDTEDYRARREDSLRRYAMRMANRAQKTGRRVVVEPMNPYERRVMHTALQEHPSVETHSEGEEPNRHVVITLKAQRPETEEQSAEEAPEAKPAKRKRSRHRPRKRPAKPEGAADTAEASAAAEPAPQDSEE